MAAGAWLAFGRGGAFGCCTGALVGLLGLAIFEILGHMFLIAGPILYLQDRLSARRRPRDR